MEPVSKTPDCVIVSAFGRGHALARNLTIAGWSVNLIDTTNALGPWEPEDWDGPWCQLGAEDTATLAAPLVGDENPVPLRNGYSLWLPRGPLEMHGPLASFYQQSFEIPAVVKGYLQPNAAEEIAPLRAVTQPAPLKKTAGRKKAAEGDESDTSPGAIAHSISDLAKEEASSISSSESFSVSSSLASTLAGWTLFQREIKSVSPLKGRERAHRQVRNLRFDEAWLAHLAHAIASNVYLENSETMDCGGPSTLLADCGVRYRTRQSSERALKSLEAMGVKVTRDASIADIRFSGSVLDAIEVVAERHGVLPGHAFVWMLSSQETTQLSESLVEPLFPNGVAQPSWCWARYRLRLNGNSASRALPLAFAVVENNFLPWTHANLILTKRVPGKDAKDSHVRIDAWMRLPVHSIKDVGYHERLQDELLAIFERRIPLSEPTCEALPLDASSTASLQAVRFPIFAGKELQRFHPRSARNLFFDGPELWDGLDLASQVRHQTAILGGLARMKTAWEAAERRAEVRP